MCTLKEASDRLSELAEIKKLLAEVRADMLALIEENNALKMELAKEYTKAKEAMT